MIQFEDEDLAQFEEQLTRALRRVDAPEGFADRTLARLRLQPRSATPLMKLRRQVWLGGSIAAALVAGVFAAGRMQQRRKSELVQQQFEAGIRITDQALDHARDQLERAGVGIGK